MIESLIRKYNDDENFLPEIIASIEKMDVEDLISIYLGYSSSVYFIRYQNISKVLNLMCDKIIEKLDKISPLKVIELYTDIYLKTLETTERLEKNRNFLKERSSRLADNDYIESEARRRNVSKDVFLNNYILGVKNPQKDLECTEMAFKFIDKLQTNMFNYLEFKLKNLSSVEQNEVVLYLDKKIKENDEEILRREEILRDESKISILVKYGQYGNSRFQVCLRLDPTELKTKNEDIYKSLRAIVSENTIRK